MKKILQGLALLTILSLGFISCKTASVMKRHYNKGYYVSKKHKHGEIKTTEQTARKESTVSLDPAPGEKLVKITAPEFKQDVIMKDEMPVKNTSTDPITNNKEKDKAIANAFGGKDLFKGITSMPRSLRSGLVGQDDVARDALSLLWIVIVVLLIVYIVGLLLDLFGIGPIFHILGAIVLVLLILWLLRII